ncbi:hypothetical protein BSPCLSOX_454 [uncultured Gammaproteobacteria bacterium]|nr:hypothetical protein [uncultured Gammaproteobacteria bacterium]VVH54746.1 hypothetical protein BSPCLSOX_454 [uncultured Gammaproteobacteria bacterium]
MGTEMLIPNNRERTIDALARNNSIIKSLFHFEKKITFLIVSLAIQKIKANLHIGGLVIITKLEIQDLKTGNDAKVGINKLIELIRKDLEIHNFFNLYSPNSGLKDIRQGLIQKTALTKDLFNDLVIHFDENMFKVFKSEKNYTIQSLNQLVNCKENQIIVLYALTQPYAKPNSPYLKLNVLELRLYLRIADDSYTMPRTLTLRVKKICQKITNTTDINLTVIPIKKNGTTGVTIGYQFRSEFKNQKTITKIEDVKIIDSKPRSNRQQLSNWGVSKKQIDTWIANLDTKTINDAINQTLSRSKHKGNRSNSGGYIYSILGDGKSLELTKQIKSNKEVFDCLEKFGLSNNDIKKVKKQTNNNRHVLRAVTNKCLRKLADETVDADDMRQFFIDQLDEVLNELKQL